MNQLTIILSHFDNDAFQENQDIEVARILRKLASQIEEGSYPHVLMDLNGNKVGTIETS